MLLLFHALQAFQPHSASCAPRDKQAMTVGYFSARAPRRAIKAEDIACCLKASMQVRCPHKSSLLRNQMAKLKSLSQPTLGKQDRHTQRLQFGGMAISASSWPPAEAHWRGPCHLNLPGWQLRLGQGQWRPRTALTRARQPKCPSAAGYHFPDAVSHAGELRMPQPGGEKRAVLKCTSKLLGTSIK